MLNIWLTCALGTYKPRPLRADDTRCVHLTARVLEPPSISQLEGTTVIGGCAMLFCGCRAYVCETSQRERVRANQTFVPRVPSLSHVQDMFRSAPPSCQRHACAKSPDSYTRFILTTVLERTWAARFRQRKAGPGRCAYLSPYVV